MRGGGLDPYAARSAPHGARIPARFRRCCRPAPSAACAARAPSPGKRWNCTPRVPWYAPSSPRSPTMVQKPRAVRDARRCNSPLRPGGQCRSPARAPQLGVAHRPTRTGAAATGAAPCTSGAIRAAVPARAFDRPATVCTSDENSERGLRTRPPSPASAAAALAEPRVRHAQARHDMASSSLSAWKRLLSSNARARRGSSGSRAMARPTAGDLRRLSSSACSSCSSR